MITAADIRKLQLDLTSYCTLSCPYCSRTKVFTRRGRDGLPPGHLPLALIRKRFEPLLANLLHVNFCGTFGEPTMHPEFLDIVSFFRERSRARISIDTNGVTHEAEWWRSLSFPRLHVRFAIDGATPESYVRYRMGADFQRTMSNLEAFVVGGGKAEWQFIVFEHNEGEIDQARAMARRIGCDIDFRRSRAYGETLAPPAEFDGPIQRCERCKFVDGRELYVAYDGIVEFCCRLQPRWMDSDDPPDFVRRYLYRLDDLSLHRHSVEEILASEYFQFMIEHYQEVCHKYYPSVTSVSAKGD
ncbi:MAG: radical SAM protein [bacterium]